MSIGKQGWSFGNNEVHLGYDEKYHRGLPDYPPFPVSELNTTNSDGVGVIIRDNFGRIYMKVRYVDAGANTVPGSILAWAGAAHACNAEPNFAAQADYASGVFSPTDATAYVAHQLEGKLLLATASAANAHPWARIIYDNAATSGGKVGLTISDLRRDIMPGIGAYDGNAPTAAATAPLERVLPTNATKVGYYYPLHDVIRSKTAVATNLYSAWPCGIALDAVTAATGVLPSSTYYYTWMQIWGPGTIYASGNGTAIVDGGLILATTTEGLGIGNADATNLTQLLLNSIAGVALQASAAATTPVRAFIRPAMAPRMGI